LAFLLILKVTSSRRENNSYPKNELQIGVLVLAGEQQISPDVCLSDVGEQKVWSLVAGFN